MPSAGDLIYVPSSLYVTHGCDDFHGGLCRIIEVKVDGNPNKTYVIVEENPGVEHNYRYLLELQEELKAEYGDARGHLSPDNRPDFEEWGDVP